tara:strand:+ start:344 stop:865 length:522 start_codon:yes stop_codon:yes gene_type:complete
MNIISGKYKRRKLLYPKQRQFRPTKSIVREAVFSMIGPNIEDASFLDLCSGTGAMGLEAESRGASRVVCVDRDSRYLTQNVELLNASAHVVRSDAIRYLKTIDQPFDYIYFDPVWSDHAIYQWGIELILKSDALVQHGQLFVEYDSFNLKLHFPDILTRDYRYGTSMVSLILN